MATKNKSILSMQHNSSLSVKDGKHLKSLWLSIPAYCHLKCPYCFASTNESDKKIDSLSFEQYEKIIVDFAEMGGEFIGIPGDGEPFHKDNWVYTKFIIDLCDKLNIKLALFTTGDSIFFKNNGNENDIDYSKIEDIIDKNIVILIKYNHSNPIIQNSLVGRKNSNYSSLREKAIEILIDKYHLNDDKKRLGLVTSIMNENATKLESNGKLEIVNIFERTQRDNLIFDCDTILELGRGNVFSNIQKQVPPEIDMVNVFKALTNAGAVGLSQGGTYVGNTCCDRILHHLYIKADGDVYPCIGCSREDIQKEMNIGNINNMSLNEIWNNKLRRRLAEDRFGILTGVCANCENFHNEECYSCLGRCIQNHDPNPENNDSAFNEDGTIKTIGCIHHKPSTQTWLSETVDYIRTILSYEQIQSNLKTKGLEYFWRPNKNLAYSLWQLDKKQRSDEINKIVNSEINPQEDDSITFHSNIYDSNVSKFSLKKHYLYSELSFPMNKVWDFIKDPNLFEESKNLDENKKNKFIDSISQSFLSNIFLPSFNILYEKYDKLNQNILYTNFMIYDNIKKEYFYRSIVNIDLINEQITNINEKDKTYIKSLIISRWYENFNIENQKSNKWKKYCFNLSSHFRHDIYGDYELKLTKSSKSCNELLNRTIDLSGILEIVSEKAKSFYEFIDKKDNLDDYESLLNSKIFVEQNGKQIKDLSDFYDTLNYNIFYPLDDEVNIPILENMMIGLIDLGKDLIQFEDCNKILNNITELKFVNIAEKVNNLYEPNSKSSRQNNEKMNLILKLIQEFVNQINKSKGSQFLNYFVYLGIMREVLKVNYYYVLHSTNFTTKDPESSSSIAKSKYKEIIKPSGILICTKEPIMMNFRSELKLYISSIFAPFEEFYYNKLIGDKLADLEFKNKIEAHRHTINNLLPPLYNYLNKVEMKKFGTIGLNIIKTILYDFIKRYEELGSMDNILNKIVEYFNSGYNIENCGYKIYNIKTITNISSSNISIGTKQQVAFFTICLNLLHNASKFENYNNFEQSDNKYILVTAEESNSIYTIKIYNPGLIEEKYLEMINKTKLYDDDIKTINSNKPTSGLVISKKHCEENNWQLN